jgi:hypothetical protein
MTLTRVFGAANHGLPLKFTVNVFGQVNSDARVYQSIPRANSWLSHSWIMDVKSS